MAAKVAKQPKTRKTAKQPPSSGTMKQPATSGTTKEAPRSDGAKEIVVLPLSELRTNGGTQMRALISQDVIQDYAEVLDELPPIIVFCDGKQYWLADGFHRYKAFQYAGRDSIPCEIRNGTRRDAILFAVGANATHGLRRSLADRRKAILAMLADKEFCRWSNREVARQCHVSRGFVDVLRRQIEERQLELDPNRRRLAATARGIISQPAVRKAPAPSTNGTNGTTGTMAECPKCHHRFAVA